MMPLRRRTAFDMDYLLARLMPQSPPPAARRLPHPFLAGALLFTFLLAGYFLSFNVDQPAHNGDWYLRYQVTCSIVEHNSFAIQPYRPDARSGPGVGHAWYAQYTLGQTTAMIPLYLLGRALAGLAHTNCNADVAPPIVLLTCKALGLILGALLGVLFFATARLLGSPPRRALALTLCLAFATSLWPDVLSNLEHTMESLFLLTAAYAALRYSFLPAGQERRRAGSLWLLVMGLAAGLVFVTRVAGIIVIPIFPLYLLLLLRRRHGAAWGGPLRRTLALYTCGVAPSLAINAAYNLLRFGSPLRAEPRADHSFGVPSPLALPGLLVSPGKGIIWYTPAVLLLVLAARPYWRRAQLPALLGGIIGAVYLLFYSAVTYWHGDPAWGPRYLYATLPYLILPLDSVFARFRAYPLRLRALVVGILALSFMVQLTAVSVSYWRYYHYMMATHHDQVTLHPWGQDMGYWWAPDQSPIVVSLGGALDIMRTYVDHRPLLSYPPGEQYSLAQDRCDIHPFGRTAVCLTDLDDLRYRSNFNTFAPWWLHTYPWWDADEVETLVLVLLALFLGSGLALARYVPRHDALPAAGPVRSRTRVPSSPLALLGGAALCAVLLFGGALGSGAATAPKHTPPLIRVVPVSATVRDGGWTYRVVRIVSVNMLGTGFARAAEGSHFDIVVLQVDNLQVKPAAFKPQWFALTDARGEGWPRITFRGLGVRPSAFGAAWVSVLGHQVVDRSLVYLVHGVPPRLMLLGPGLTLVRLAGVNLPRGLARLARQRRRIHRVLPRPPAPPRVVYAMTVRDGLRLRLGPSTSSPVVRLLSAGSVLRLATAHGVWWSVVDRDGVHGYVFGPAGRVLDPVAPGRGVRVEPAPLTVVVDTGALRVRSGPDLQAHVLAVEPRDAHLVLLAHTAHWDYVELLDGERGWAWRGLMRAAD